MNRQATDWEKISTIHLSDNIRESYNSVIKTPIDPTGKRATDVTGTLPSKLRKWTISM